MPRKVNLITDSNFTRVYEVPGYSVVEVRGRELGSQHRDAIYALFRLKREKVSMPNPTTAGHVHSADADLLRDAHELA